VGVDGLALPTVPGPEVEIRDGAAIGLGLSLQGSGCSINAIAIDGFGNAPASSTDADILVNASAAGVTITSCVIGASATSFTDPGAAARSGGDHVRLIGGDNGIVQGCLIGFAVGTGISIGSGSNGWQVLGCEIRGNAIGQGARDGIGVASSGTLVARGNLVIDHDGCGIDTNPSTGSNTIENNTVMHCGRLGTSGTDTPGVRLGGPDNLLDRNRIFDNWGAGTMVNAAATNNRITRNSMSGNGTIAATGGGAASGQIGIDLLSGTDDVSRGTAPYVTLNDLNDADAGANGLLNFPVLESAVLANGSFTLTGWTRPGSTIELFVSDGDPSGFGEGATWVTSLVEGSASDLDASSSAYPATVNGLAQGTDVTNRFRFTMAAPPGVSSSTKLTATATVTGIGTSEFSGVVSVTTGVAVGGFAYSDLNHDAGRDPGENGTGAAIWMKLVPAGGTSARQVVPADPASGAYTFTFVNAAGYDIVLDDNPSAADVTPGYPSGWIGTQNPAGVRPGLTVGATDVSDQNLGLWHGGRIDGRVFRDDGASGGAANDGQAQGGETGIAAARVRLASGACSGGACDSTLTRGGGAYTLWLPFAATGGSVSVVEGNPAGWLSTGGSPGTTGGAYSRAADATTFNAASGLAWSGVDFGDVPPNTFVAGGAQSVAAGAVASYAHTFTAGSAGLVSFGVAQSPSPAIPGWDIQLFRDLDCNGVVDAGEPAIVAPLAVAPGQSVCLVARHQSPAGAPGGARETATLSASFTYTGASPPLGSLATLDDVTSVVAAGTGLVLTKSVDRASARPGDLLTYTITYANLGSQPVSGVVIHDATPAFTGFASAGCGSPGGGITGCSVSAPAAGASGPVSWTLAGALTPGASGSVSFVVRVQ
jgi:uncharacterized repeat protein (TIGR01451 family)